MIIIKKIFIIIGLSFSISSHSQLIKNFSSDGCTLAADGFPGGKISWRDCCVEHDLWFWVGGDKSSRHKADINLKECIGKKSSKIVAKMYYLGIQMGKMSPFKLSGRHWANAWSDHLDYKKLSKQQILLIQEEIKKVQIPFSIRENLEKDLEQRLSSL